MADKKFSELETASEIKNSDFMALSQDTGGGYVSLKATILAIATKMLTAINFTSALQTEDKTVLGAINEVAQGGGGGGGGHVIVDDNDDSLTQRENLKFAGTYSEDDSTNSMSVVNISRQMTRAEFNLLSEDEKKGLIQITDEVEPDDSMFYPVIYSTEEREVGVWTGGKPLYQKTCQIASNTSVGSWTTVTLTSPISNPEKIIKAEFNDGSPSGYGQKTYLFRADNENVQVKTTDGSTTTFNAGWRFTLWYTKTTDVAGSGSWTPQGVPAHHYSTDEQVIGTWIDGSTLYEKTIDKHTSPVAVNSNTWTTFDTFSTDIKIIDARALSISNGDIEASHCVNALYENGEIKILQTRNASISVGYLIIQYTKSS